MRISISKSISSYTNNMPGLNSYFEVKTRILTCKNQAIDNILKAVMGFCYNLALLLKSFHYI